MQQDCSDLEGKIENINSTIATELTKATEPFTIAINSLQSSQQQFFGLFQQMLLPQLQQQSMLPMLPAPTITTVSQPVPILSPSSMSVQMQNQQLNLIQTNAAIPPLPPNTTTGTATQSNPNMPSDPAIRLPKVKVEPGAKV